jgi:hypothetical protein
VRLSVKCRLLVLERGYPIAGLELSAGGAPVLPKAARVPSLISKARGFSRSKVGTTGDVPMSWSTLMRVDGALDLPSGGGKGPQPR